ncbi:MAG: LTA synthase family protein [Myxococcus sp.]|nr:LTA synthase family protein [Myxococcus sp.]
MTSATPSVGSRLVLFVAASVASTVVLEAFNRASLTAVAGWLWAAPLEALLNVTLAMMVNLAALALVGHLRGALLGVGAFIVGLGALHATKSAVLGKPLFPWDFLFYRETVALLPQLLSGPRVAVGLLGLGLLGLVAAQAWRTRHPPLSGRARLGLGVVALLGAVTVPSLTASLRPLGVRNLFWSQTDNYLRNGFGLSLVFNVRSALVTRPAGYAPEAVRTLAATLPVSQADAGVRPPTLVVVMSESFFDPTTLPNVRFLDDPVPVFHRLQRAHRSGTLYAPVYGGGTANTEFEVLTGHSMRFLPSGSIPYQQYIHAPQPSLARAVSRLGYRTEAVHSYHRWFWERGQVYEHLGFDRFTSVEDMPGALELGPYPADRFLTQHVIDTFERTSGGPAFIFGVSVEAHGPYDVPRVAVPRVRFEAPLDALGTTQLSTYVEAIHNADHELGVLVEYLERQATPVQLLFFGDHQPSLPHVLRQLGVLESERLNEMTSQERLVVHRVPALLWTNQRPSTQPIPTMSTSLLGPWMLEAAGLSGTPYDAFLRQVSARMPVAVDRFVIDADGGVYDQAPSELAQLEEDWWLLEYDQLMGEQALATGYEGS